MNLKIINKIKQTKVEGIIISLLTGWLITSILYGDFKEIFNQFFPADLNPILYAAVLVVCSMIIGFIYYIKASYARIIMFFSVYIFLILCAFFSYGINIASNTDIIQQYFPELWETRGYSSVILFNNLGGTLLMVTLCFFLFLTYQYLEDDLYQLFTKLRFKKHHIKIILIILCIITFILTGAASILRYISYKNGTFDFGLYSQMFEYMRQTGRMETTLERNYLLSHLAVHYSPIYYLLLPLYFIIHSPITINLAFACMIILPVVPITLLCKKYELHPWITIGIICVYIFYPVTMNQIYSDIHENCFLTFLLLMVLWAMEDNRSIMLIIFSILTLIVKEDAAFYILCIGLYCIISQKAIPKGTIMSAASILYFSVIKMIMGMYNIGNSVGLYDESYDNLLFHTQNSNLFQIIYTILANPLYTMGQITSNVPDYTLSRIEYICFMIIPVMLILFYIKRNYSRLILMLPFMVFNLLPTDSGMHNIISQYNFGVIALFIYIMILNINDLITDSSKDKDTNKLLTYRVLTISFLCSTIMFTGSMLPKLQFLAKDYNQNKEIYQSIDRVLTVIPRNQSIAASSALTPHLSDALELYDINDSFADKTEQAGGLSDSNINQAYYLVLLNTDMELDNVQYLLNTGYYQLSYADNIMCIYQKQTE